jgi:protein-S-isoprenylcysteine O-methyltransferase Ste14
MPDNSGVRTFAWSGALLFASALLYSAWCYAGPFGAMSDGTDAITPALIDVALFSVFALHHSVLARSGAKALVMRVVPPALERTVYVWIASLLFIGVCAWWRPVPGLLWQTHGAVAWTLRALTLAGVWLTLQSALMLDVFELAGTRPFMAARGGSDELKTHGPYGLVRHPIYLAWLLLVWTPAEMNGTRLVFAAISSVYLAVAIPLEDRSLHQSLGAKYADYVVKVRWRMLPGVY